MSASTPALDDLAERYGETGPVEEYEIRQRGRRMKYGKPHEQVKGAAMLDGLQRLKSCGRTSHAKLRSPLS